MVEAGADAASEAEVIEAIEFGHDCCKKIAAGIRELVKLAGKPKRSYTPPEVNKTILDKISTAVRAELTDALNTQKYGKAESYSRIHDAKDKSLALFAEDAEKAEAPKVFEHCASAFSATKC